MFGYRKDKVSGLILDYWDLAVKPKDTDKWEFIECLESEKPECYQEPQYNDTDLIAWAMQEYPSLIASAHEHVLMTFAKDPDKYKGLMLARAAIVDTAVGGKTFTTVANALIAKAIELGADITPAE